MHWIIVRKEHYCGSCGKTIVKEEKALAETIDNGTNCVTRRYCYKCGMKELELLIKQGGASK